MNENKQNAYRELVSLYRRFYMPMVNYAGLHLKSGRYAQDIVQDVFLKLLSQAQDIERIENLSSFLFIMVRNECIDHLRRQKKGMVVMDTLKDRSNDSYVDIIGEQELNRIYQMAIQELSPQKKRIYVLKKLEGLTFKEIGCCLQISPMTAKSTYKIATSEVRFYFSKRTGITPVKEKLQQDKMQFLEADLWNIA